MAFGRAMKSGPLGAFRKALERRGKKYGDVLDRDGYHLNERGRTLAGILWAYYLLGLDIDISSFRPSGYSYDDVTGPIDDKEIDTLISIAKETIRNNKGHNLHG